MEEDLKFECFECHCINPVKLTKFEIERMKGRVKKDSPKGIFISRKCEKCGKENKIYKGRKYTVYLGDNP